MTKPKTNEFEIHEQRIEEALQQEAARHAAVVLNMKRLKRLRESNAALNKSDKEGERA